VLLSILIDLFFVCPGGFNVDQFYEQQNLEIHQDADGTVFVKDLVTIPINSVEDVCAGFG
jgi:hypothetical protein